MFPEQLKKILKLVKTTGDRVIIFDANSPEDSYVVMDINNYSKMVSVPVGETVEKITEIKAKTEEKENLTEEDLTDKINREISMWKNRENLPYLDEEEKTKKAWSIPSQVKNKAQEVG
jgi:ribosomal protein L30E